MLQSGATFRTNKPMLPGWFDSNAGKALIAEETAALASLVPDQFYRVGLQYGLNAKALVLDLNVEQMIYCDSGKSDESGSSTNVLALPEALPLSDSSVDLVLMPHTLDFCEDPHRVLREISQVLSPEGVLVLSGFHPYSLWGARRRVGRKSAPFDARFISRTVIQDRLELLGFVPLTGRTINYQFPQMNALWRGRSDWMNAMGDRWWPTLGAVYILVVQKKIYSGLSIKKSKVPSKRWFPDLKPAQAKVTQYSDTPNSK